MLKNKRYYYYKSEQHPFHLVDPSPWPFIVSFYLFFILTSTVRFFHGEKFGFLFFLGLIGFFYSVINWFYDIVIEGTYEGQHTLAVQYNLRLGMLLFILSEVMFFFSFFWAFFHSSLAPSIWIGSIWPPLGIKILDPWGIPLLNTLILLSSGVTVTWAHRMFLNPNITKIWDSEKQTSAYFDVLEKTYKAQVNNPNTEIVYFNDDCLPSHKNRYEAILALFLTIFLGVIFTGFQLYEYNHASFTIADGIYGTTFYLITGFHGLHVLIGTIFLIVCLVRLVFYHFTMEQHIGLEAAIWYWHFVDVVWLIVFIFVYIWGSSN